MRQELQLLGRPTSRCARPGLDFYYGGKQALHSIALQVPTGRITALIGPSGCGKTTFLRILNRMYETVPQARPEGEVLLDGEDIFSLDVVNLRRRVGMVFQKPNPFPKSIFDNIAYGLRINGMAGKGTLAEAVEKSLQAGRALGGGQRPAP